LNCFFNNSISDEGLTEISKPENLTKLHIANTQITNDVPKELYELKKTGLAQNSKHKNHSSGRQGTPEIIA
jgi:hypothetical protein